MKLVYSNGKFLEIRNVSDVLMRFDAASCPVKYNGYRIVEDDEARDIATELIDDTRNGLYARTI